MVIASILTSLRESRKAIAIRSSLPASVSIMTGVWAARLAARAAIRKQFRRTGIHPEYRAWYRCWEGVHHEEAPVTLGCGDWSAVDGSRGGGGCQRQMEGGVYDSRWDPACQYVHFQGRGRK